MSETYAQYVMNLETQLDHLYKLSEKAREKGLDPTREVECNLARDLADLVEGLVGPEGVADSIRDLSTKLPREELAFKIAEEIIYGKFGHIEAEKAAEQAVRTSLAILTEGLTAAPLQGVAKVRIKKLPIVNDKSKADDVLDLEQIANATILAVNGNFHVKEGYPIKLGDELMILGEIAEINKIRSELEKIGYPP